MLIIQLIVIVYKMILKFKIKIPRQRYFLIFYKCFCLAKIYQKYTAAEN